MVNPTGAAWRRILQHLSKGGVFELIFWLVLAALGFYFSFEFDRKIEFYRFGAANWPRAILILIVMAALGQWWTHRRSALLSDLALTANQASAPEEQGAVAAAPERRIGVGVRLAITFGLPLLYAALWEQVGFYVLTPVFLIAYLYLTGERRLQWLIGAPLVIFGALTFIFTRLLYVGLPVGNWRPFYDISNWLVALLRG